MNIASVCVGVPADDAATLRIIQVSRILRLFGHRVDMIYYHRRSQGPGLLQNVELSGTLSVRANPASVPFRHLSIVRSGAYDLVYANTDSAAFSSLPSKLLGVPLLFDMHGLIAEEYAMSLGGLCYNPLHAMTYLRYKMVNLVDTFCADGVVCVSKRMMAFLHRRGIPWNKLVYAPNGVDLDMFKSSPPSVSEELKLNLGFSDRFVIGYAGGFQVYQGVENLMAVAKSVRDDGLAFLIVGGDAHSHSDNVLILPRIPRSELPKYYSVCDALVLPRPLDVITDLASPTKFAEYASMGKPVLTTRVGDCSDLVDKYDCGVVVKDNSASSLSDGIRQLRAAPDDDLRRMGANSRKLAENEFNWTSIGRSIAGLVETVGKKDIIAESKVG